MWLSDCYCIVTSTCSKRNLILDLSDLLLDSIDLILIASAGPGAIGLSSQLQASVQALQLCVVHGVLCVLSIGCVENGSDDSFEVKPDLTIVMSDQLHAYASQMTGDLIQSRHVSATWQVAR